MRFEEEYRRHFFVFGDEFTAETRSRKWGS